MSLRLHRQKSEQRGPHRPGQELRRGRSASIQGRRHGGGSRSRVAEGQGAKDLGQREPVPPRGAEPAQDQRLGSRRHRHVRARAPDGTVE